MRVVALKLLLLIHSMFKVTFILIYILRNGGALWRHGDPGIHILRGVGSLWRHGDTVLLRAPYIIPFTHLG